MRLSEYIDERAAEQALADYLRAAHCYEGSDQIEDAQKWLEQHDEYLSVEIFEQDAPDKWGGHCNCVPFHLDNNLAELGADMELLKRQAALVGKVVDGSSLTEEERSCIEGLWEFVHTLIDRMEG